MSGTKAGPRTPRTLWKGAITFGLVSVPVALYPATRREAELPFRLLHRPDLAPIDYKRFCSKEDVEVDWGDIVKGYEYARGRFVVVTEEDFKRARVAATHTIEIRDFVRAADIDIGHFESPYWLAPTREGRKPYVLLARARGDRHRRHPPARASGGGPAGRPRAHAGDDAVRR